MHSAHDGRPWGGLVAHKAKEKPLDAVPPGMVQRFKDAFVPSYRVPFAIQTPKQQQKRSWFTETKPGRYLTDSKIEAHLAGRYYIGPVASTYTRSVCVDLDRGRHWRSLDKRTQQVLDVFPQANPLIFSTPRHGRHLHFMLDGPVWATSAAEYATDQLGAAGLDLAAGQIEVYPAGNKALRAPLGRDCYLLDVDTFDPVHPLHSENLHTLDALLERQQYDLIDIPGTYRPKETPAGASRRLVRVDPDQASEFMLEVDQLLRDGLTGPGQRNDAFLKLSWFMHVIWGFDGERTAQELWAWIRSHHNGHSQDYNRDPQAVYRKCQQVVQYFDWDKVSSGHKATNPPPAADDLIQSYVDQTLLDDRSRAFLARLLRYARQRGQETLDGCLEVQIPSRTMKSYDRQYGPILRELIEAGHVQKIGQFATHLKRCCRYRFKGLGGKTPPNY